METDTQPADVPQKPPRAGSVGLRNAFKNGLAHRGRSGLSGTKLPPKLRNVQVSLNIFRSALERRVIDLRGEISLQDKVLIDAAYHWQRHCKLAGRWLSEAFNELSAADKLKFSSEASRAAEARNKAILQLRIAGPDDSDFFKSLSSMEAADDGSEDA